MTMQDDTSSGTPRLRSVEHHHFLAQGRWLLFDVNALTVLASSPLDRAILRRAAEEVDDEALVADLITKGEAIREVQERISVLARNRFLLPVGEEPEPTAVGSSSTYMTFMINVSQRCNLTCPYCYVNQGRFDYQELPVVRLEPSSAGMFVDRIFALFPNHGTY